MPKQTMKKTILAIILMLLLFIQLGLTMEQPQDRRYLICRFESTFWQEMKQVFGSIRYNPADIYYSVFSNSGWSIQ